MRRIAILDACVLHQARTRDLLLQFAVDGFYQAKWSTKIEDEFVRSLETKRPDLAGKLEHLVTHMRVAIPDWESSSSDKLEAPLKHTDPGDRHVLGAAIACEATHLVTWNRKHFSDPEAANFSVEITDPDLFLTTLLQSNFTKGLTSIRTTRTRLRKPSLTAAEYCESLKPIRLVRLAGLIEPFLSQI